MTISIKARKAKGRKLQNYVRDLILATFPLQLEDAKPAIMGEKGVDIKLSRAALHYIPFDIECKNDENKSIWKCWEQCAKNAQVNKPLLFMMKNYHEPLTILRPTDLFDLLNRVKELEKKVEDLNLDKGLNTEVENAHL